MLLRVSYGRSSKGVVYATSYSGVGDISIIFPCSFAVGITQQYGIYVLLG